MEPPICGLTGPMGPLCYLSLSSGQSNLDLVSSLTHVKTEKGGDKGTIIAVKKNKKKGMWHDIAEVAQSRCWDWDILPKGRGQWW